MRPKTDHEGHYAPELIISKLCLELPSVSLTVRELSGGTAHNIDIKADWIHLSTSRHVACHSGTLCPHQIPPPPALCWQTGAFIYHLYQPNSLSKECCEHCAVSCVIFQKTIGHECLRLIWICQMWGKILDKLVRVNKLPVFVRLGKIKTAKNRRSRNIKFETSAAIRGY